MKQSNNRRLFLKKGLGSALGLSAVKAIADVCQSRTEEQPLGPFFPKENTPIDEIRENNDSRIPIFQANDNDLTQVKGRQGVASGQVVLIKGHVISKSCEPIKQASIVIWQASNNGRYNHKGDDVNTPFVHPKTGETIQRTLDPHFQYWGSTQTDSQGRYEFKTIVPGFYPADLASRWYRPPHIHFMVSALGFPQLVTQMYFEGDKLKDKDWIKELNSKDLILQNEEPEEQRRLTVNFENDVKHKLEEEIHIGQFDIFL